MFKWNKMKYWQKGLIIGLICGFLLYVFSFSGMGFGVIFWWMTGTVMCVLFNFEGHGCFFAFLYFGWFFFPILYGLVGALIGLLIDKYKPAKKRKK